MHNILTLLMSLDGSIYLCILLLTYLTFNYIKKKDHEILYFLLSCISYTMGELCYDYINAIVKLPLDLIFYFLFYYFIFLFLRLRTKILLKNPIIEKKCEIKTWIIITIDFFIFAVFSFLIYFVFDRTSLLPQVSHCLLNYLTISNFIYPVFDFLILRYFIHISTKYILSDRKLYLPLIAGIFVWTIGDFLVAYEGIFAEKSYTLGNYLQILGLIFLIIILALLKTSKTGSDYTTLDLRRKNSKITNYALLINFIVVIYLSIDLYCLCFKPHLISRSLIDSCGISILLLLFIRLSIINFTLEFKLGEMYKDASADPLTGLYSRKYGFAMMKRLYESSLYFNMEISIIMLDIDNFKIYNDSYGHVNGDYALMDISKLISNNTDVSGFACRYGGEEFMIILPGADEKKGMLIAEKIRSSIESYTFNESNNITVSIGGATSGATVKSAIDLIEQADAALYKAKEVRNTCSWYHLNMHNECINTNQ